MVSATHIYKTYAKHTILFSFQFKIKAHSVKVRLLERDRDLVYLHLIV